MNSDLNVIFTKVNINSTILSVSSQNPDDPEPQSRSGAEKGAETDGEYLPTEHLF